jgi:integration host factor subunit alpha
MPKAAAIKKPSCVTRMDLTDAVARTSGLSGVDSAAFVNAVLEEIIAALVKGEDVKLRSFGTFSLRSKVERMGRNPKTKEQHLIPARRVVTFRASPTLRARTNGEAATVLDD